MTLRNANVLTVSKFSRLPIGGGVLTYYNLSTETKDLIKKVADEHAEFRSKIIKVNKLKGIT